MARKSEAPRTFPALPPAIAPEVGVAPALAPVDPPALPDTSEGVPAAAALPVAAPAEVVAAEEDESRGFLQHWFDFSFPSFCEEVPVQAPAARGALSREHDSTWRELAPYIRKTLTRRDGGGDNRFLAFMRHSASPLSYNKMAKEALGWIVAQRTEDAKARMAEKLDEWREKYTSQWMRDGFPADVAAAAWAVLEADLVKCWEKQLTEIIQDYEKEAESQWTMLAPGAVALTLAFSDSKSGEDEESDGDEEESDDTDESLPSSGRRQSRESGASSGGSAKKRRK